MIKEICDKCINYIKSTKIAKDLYTREMCKLAYFGHIEEMPDDCPNYQEYSSSFSSSFCSSSSSSVSSSEESEPPPKPPEFIEKEEMEL